MSNIFDNQTDSQLIYEYDELDLQLKAIQERLDQVKQELKDRGVKEGKGKTRMMTMSEQTSKRLDQKRLKADLGEEICDQYQMDVKSTVIRWKQVLPEILRAA
jgi:vancomycin resistance protein YoaR